MRSGRIISPYWSACADRVRQRNTLLEACFSQCHLMVIQARTGSSVVCVWMARTYRTMDSQMIVKLPRTVIQPPSSAARAVNGAWRDTTIWNSLNSYVLSTLCADDSAPHNIKAVWNLYGNFSFQTRYNIAIAPSQEVPVIIRNAGRNEAKLMKWGLVPSRAPDPSMPKTVTVPFRNCKRRKCNLFDP